MTAVSVQTDATFAAGSPEVLFEGNYFFAGPGRNYDIAPDGQRFLMIKAGGGSDETSAPTSIIVVENWLDELAQRTRPDQSSTATTSSTRRTCARQSASWQGQKRDNRPDLAGSPASVDQRK